MSLLVVAANAPAWLRTPAPDRLLCDGVNDDVEIQQAIDSCKQVRLSEGDFWIAAPVRHHALVDVGGAGEERTRVFQVPGPAFDPWTSGAYPAAGDCYRASLHDLTIVGISNGDPQFGYGTVVFRGGEFITIERVAFRNMQGTGLLLMACPHATVRDFLFEGNNVDGFCAYDGSNYLSLGPGVARDNRGYNFLILGAEVAGQSETVGWQARGLVSLRSDNGIGVLSGARRGSLMQCVSSYCSGHAFLFRSAVLGDGTLAFVSDVTAVQCSGTYTGGAAFRADGTGGAHVDDLHLTACHAQNNERGYDLAYTRNAALHGCSHRGNGIDIADAGINTRIFDQVTP